MFFSNFTKKTIFYLGIILLFLNISGCGLYKRSDIKDNPVNVKERARKNVAEGRSLSLSNIGKKGGGNFEFATANPLWRATLGTLDFIPIQSANYSGGILVTDWYSEKSNKDSIKIEVRFLSNELAVSSLRIISYKRTCIQMNCEIRKSNEEFNQQIKSKILEEARRISLQDKKRSKK